MTLKKARQVAFWPRGMGAIGRIGQHGGFPEPSAIAAWPTTSASSGVGHERTSSAATRWPTNAAGTSSTSLDAAPLVFAEGGSDSRQRPPEALQTSVELASSGRLNTVTSASRGGHSEFTGMTSASPGRRSAESRYAYWAASKGPWRVALQTAGKRTAPRRRK
jgi:hypothetical protein